MSYIKFPFVQQIKNYQGDQILGDLIAGLTVGVMLIPQGMAYAFLAGVPPVYGLYASLVPLFIYMLFGTSRFSTIGPAAISALLVLTSLNQLGISEPEAYLNAVFVIALLSGIIQLLMGFFRLGFIVNFISQPVLKGFILGAALTIILSQIKHLLGIPLESGSTISTLEQLILKIDLINIYTLSVGLAGILILILMKRLDKRIPSQLIVVGLSMAVIAVFRLDVLNVDILGVVPKGLPGFHSPTLNMDLIQALLPVSATIALITFIEVYAIGVSLEEKSKAKDIVPDQELIAMGLGKTIGSFFQAFPTSASFSRSAVNKEAGSKSVLSGIFTLILIILTLLFLTPYFYFMPKAILASIILVAITGLIDPGYIKLLWRTDRRDFIMFSVTALVTFLVGVQQGILTGVVLSVFLIAYSISYPHVAEIALVQGTKVFRNIDRFDRAQKEDRIMMIRFDAPLTYSNVPYFLKKLKQFEARHSNLECVILNASAINHIDSTSVEAVRHLVEDYKEKNIRFVITNLRGPVRDKFKQTGMFEFIGTDNFFAEDYEALLSCEGKGTDPDRDMVFQSNK
ncbi:MAG: sulfate permease [Brumimicrobium sp.]|nr:sulfate permease [Brumimicrobium sp.]